MFNKIFIENSLKDSIAVNHIIEKLPAGQKAEIEYLESYEDVFSKVKKPYLEKRKNLNLFIAEKKGTIVKEAPDAYGLGNEKHFYFVNAYNCIYECEYCYLQGFFNSPDIVLFTNWAEITKQIEITSMQYPDAWFHAGEFSDSLALSHLTGEIEHYYNLFRKLPQSKLELRTKSVNIKEILKQKPLDNIYVSFSIASAENIKAIDLKTPSLNHRLKAIKTLQDNGHQVGLHFDPICWTSNWPEEYIKLIGRLKTEINLEEIRYISLGVVRFTQDVYFQFEKNYPKSLIHSGEFKRSFDNKIRYPKALRKKMLSFIRKELTINGVSGEKIYDCME